MRDYFFSHQTVWQLKKFYDIIIIGASGAGLSAALYAARDRKSVLVIEKNGGPGGQLTKTWIVEDYPGIKSIKAIDLANAFADHAKSFGAEILYGTEVVNVNFVEKYVETTGFFKEKFFYKKLIIATGSTYKELGVKGEREFLGKGVSYCAVCDGAFFTDKEIIVVGGGNSALDEAIYLANNFAKSVTIVHRRDKFRADKILEEKVFNHKKINIMFNTEVKEIKGKDTVESVILFNNKTGEIFEKKIDGVFIFIGLMPNTKIFNVEKDENGYIITDDKMRTNVKDVFAAGDCRKNQLKQLVTAASEGAIAAFYASRELDES